MAIQSSVSHDIVVARKDFDKAAVVVESWVEGLMKEIRGDIAALEIHISHRTHASDPTENAGSATPVSSTTPVAPAEPSPAPTDPPA